jgi:O-6-methylguanine DNA methyltransferase
MAEYFAGRRNRFDLVLRPRGTAFESSVWSWLQTIPPGETRTYAQGAAAVGRPSAVRAIGRANGRNPLAIVVPCHRVIGADGDLTGYGGGLWRKQALLSLEANWHSAR